MSFHLTYSRNGQAHRLILQESQETSRPQQVITFNGRHYRVLGASPEETPEAEFLINRIKALHQEVNSESLRQNLIEWDVEAITINCPLLETGKSINEKLEGIIQREKGFEGSVIVSHQGVDLHIQRDYGSAVSLKGSGEVTYRWASITKTITAVAVLQLHEKGIIDLDAPITQYLEEYRDYPGFQGITARELLSHHSLAPDHGDYTDKLVRQKISEISDPVEKEKLERIEREYQDLVAATSDPIAKRRIPYPPELEKIEIEYFNIHQEPETMVENVMTMPLKKEPYAYNNFAFTLLALLVTKTTGSTFEQYLQENIFDKAGMKKASLASSKHDTVLAEGPPPVDDASVRFGSGNLNGSAEDLYRFDRALHQEKNLLTQDVTLQQMQDQYLGWDTEAPPEVAGHRMLGKTGAFATGNLTSYQYFPETDTTIIILSHAPSRMLERHVASMGEEIAGVLFAQ